MSRVDRPATSFREQTLLLCALIGAAQMTWGVVVPVLPVLADRYSISVSMLGVVVGAFGVGRILGNLPAGLLLTRLPAGRLVWTIALALSAVTAATALAQDVVALTVLRGLTGVFGGAAVTAGFTVLLRAAPAGSRGRVISIATVVQLSTAALGSLLGGAALGVVGPRLVFVVAALPLLLVLAFDALRPANRYWAPPGVAIEAAPSPEAPRASPPPTRAPRLLLAGLIVETAVLFVVRFSGEQGLIPLLAYGQGGLDPLGLGAALAAGTVVSLAVLLPLGRWLDSGARALPVLVATLVGVVGMTAVALLPGAGLVVGVVIASVGTSALGVVPGVVTAERFPPARVGVVVGLTRTAGDLGAAIGPLLVFLVADLVDSSVALLLLAALLAVASLGFATVVRRPRMDDLA